MQRASLMVQRSSNGDSAVRFDNTAEGSGHAIAQRAYGHATNNAEGIGHAFRGCAAGSTAMRLVITQRAAAMRFEVAQRALRPCDL